MALFTPCSSNVGTMQRVQSDAQAPLIITLTTTPPIVLSNIGIVTSIEVAMGVNAQFQTALSNAVFITPFGDQIGAIKIGFIFNRLCGSTANNIALIQTYLNNRLRPDGNLRPIYAGVGGTIFQAYLTEMNLRGESSQQSQMLTGSLTFKAWPQ